MADVFVLEPWIIWAFCFSTSAGVSIRHDTISPVEEAIPCIIGVGRACVKGRRRLFREPSGKVLFPPVMLVGASAEELYIMLFTVSYVVKNAPARSTYIGSSAVMFLIPYLSIRVKHTSWNRREDHAPDALVQSSEE
jgi:hypothetical protein